MVGAIHRVTGLYLMNKAMSVKFDAPRFMGLLSWFQVSLRGSNGNNEAHYLNGLEVSTK